MKHSLLNLLSLLVVGVCLFPVSAAYACTCDVPGSPTEELLAADLVFAGEVVRIDSTTAGLFAELAVYLRVLRVWKGADSLKVNLRTAASSAACGYPFQIGAQYLVYAYQSQADGSFGTGLCTRNSLLSAAEKDLTELGAGRVVAVEEAGLPSDFLLAQNYPNPFNPTTRITYALQRPAFVTVQVYDLHGRRVQTLVSRFQHAGEHAVTFEAGALPSGVYLYELAVGEAVERKGMVLAR